MFWTILQYVAQPFVVILELCIQKWYVGLPVILAGAFVMFMVFHNIAHMVSD